MITGTNRPVIRPTTNHVRIVHTVEPHFELVVTDERKLQITFLGEDGKTIAPADQKITGTGGSRPKPTKFAFEKKDGVLLSDKALPEGTVIPLVLRIRMVADAKAVTERISLNLVDCPTCDHLEYACTCDH